MKDSRLRNNNKVLDEKLQEQLREITLARMNALPKDVRIAIGDTELNAQELMQHIKEGDELGLELMEAQLEFLKDMASGALYANGENTPTN